MRKRVSYAGRTGYKGRVSVVIPAYNEGGAIRRVVLGVRRLFPDVIVVDDHSTDDTGAIARQSGATVFANLGGRGAGLATLHGVKASKKPVVVTLDADGQHSPSDIPGMLDPILDGEADFVVGRRARLPPSEAPVRKVVHAILGRNLDVGSGLRAFKRGYVKGMQPSDVGLCGCGGLILYALGHGARVVEVPIHISPRTQGRSKFAKVSKTSLHKKQAEFLLARYGKFSRNLGGREAVERDEKG